MDSKNHIFKVTGNTLSNINFGELIIIGSGEIVQEFVAEDSDYLLDSEFIESDFVGFEEPAFNPEELNSNYDNSNVVNQDEDNINFDPAIGNIPHLKPTKSGFLQGNSFNQTIVSGGWNENINPTYRLTGFKYGRPIITKDSWISWKKAIEGGIANGTTDSAYRKYGDRTIVTISKNSTENKKYDSLCTNMSGKRLFNIHTNKGILWLVFKSQFGESVSSQERFLKMNDDDWWTIMNKRFYEPNKGEQINSLIVRLMWISWCWGSGTSGAVKNLTICLNLLTGYTKYGSNEGKINNSMISDMNSIPEEKMISAMYDVRTQFFLNISQPNNPNRVYRNGWVNGMNKWIDRFHTK